jgi:hypothetical protein
MDPSTPTGDETSGAIGDQAGTGATSGNAAAECAAQQAGRLIPVLCHDIENTPRVRAGQLPEGFFGGVRGGGTAGRPRDGYSIPYRWILLALLGVLGTVLVATPLAKGLLRRRALRRSRDPRSLVLAAYRVFDGEAADLGLGRHDGETLEEHRRRLSATVALSDGHLSRLAAAAARAAYSESAVSADEATEAVRDARVAIADLRKDAGWARRIVGTYRPGV